MSDHTINTREDESVINVAVTGYLVSRLPDTSENQSVWGLRVEATGNGKWAVRRHRMCLGRDGVWDYERSPSERDDEWLAFYRWNSAEDAIAAAVKAEPHIVVNGLTAEDVRQRELARENNLCPDCGHPSDQQPGHRLDCPTITPVPPRLRLVTDELAGDDDD